MKHWTPLEQMAFGALIGIPIAMVIIIIWASFLTR